MRNNSDSQQRRLLYFCPSAFGGIADYARFQARALKQNGVALTFLTVPGWKRSVEDGFQIQPTLVDSSEKKAGPRLRRQLITAANLLRNAYILSREVKRGLHRNVLLASYSEYLAPLWSGQLKKLKREGVRFAAVVHDPVRDYVVGPKWWHEWSIACGYSYLTHAFVHEECDLNTFSSQADLRIAEIPIGPYPFPKSNISSLQARKKYSLPETGRVILAFGNIRDAKNLDLLIKALAEQRNCYLVVAGRIQSETQRPIGYYQALANEMGFAENCRWISRYIPEAEVGELFEASDLVAINYSSLFRSASSVLNLAVHFKKPCIASSGPGNLKTMVQRFKLGIWVEPDDVEALRKGLFLFDSDLPKPFWEEYSKENSWQRNAAIAAIELGLIVNNHCTPLSFPRA